MGKIEKEDIYIDILLSNLTKKSMVLEKIIFWARKYDEVLSIDEFEHKSIDEVIDEKELLIQEITRLDEEFENIYPKVSQRLTNNREQYKEQIISMQKKIKDITEAAIEIKTLETTNKIAMDEYIRKQKLKIRASRQSNGVAVKYYKSMSNLQINESYFIDDKK